MKKFDPRTKYKAGDTFEYEGKEILVLEDRSIDGSCKGCFFEHFGTDGPLPCLYCLGNNIKFLEVPHRTSK